MRLTDDEADPHAIGAFVDEALIRVLGSAAPVTREARLREDLGLDSLDAIQLLIEAEDRFGVVVPDDIARGLVTVQDVVALLCAACAEAE